MTSLFNTEYASTLSAPSVATNVILHAFDWPYSKVTENAKAIADNGYKAILVSPPLKSFHSKDGTQWWQRYQPQDYRVIDNQLGNTNDFRKMVETLNLHDIDIYADIVFNHMANESHERNDLNYPNSNIISQYKDKREYFDSIKLFGDLSQPLFTKDDFLSAFPIKDWKDPWQVQHGRISSGGSDPGLPSLKNNKNVVKKQKLYLKALKKIGVKGFRIDAAKHMTLNHIQELCDEDITEDMHIFGEIITDGGATKEEYELFLQPYLEKTILGAYDFPLFHTVLDVFNENASMASLINPYSLGSALENQRAITFAITHDIPNNDVFLNQVMSEENERLAYCYILGRDGGVPLVYTDLDTSGIKNSRSKPRWYDAWNDPILANMIHFHNTMHSQPMAIIEQTQDLLVFSRGEHGIVAINKGKKAVSYELPIKYSQQNHAEINEIINMEGVQLLPPSLGSETGAILQLPAQSCAMLVS
ncbi:alpha-amylase family protein [Photobacterium indicum]|uniref:alpha-amylase family protein n=1 Tax=Photobacterium indicum TaxID=81447 RepID=UPI003D0FA376